MVLIKHDVPAGVEYAYVDHTISERPGRMLETGSTSTSQAERTTASLNEHSVNSQLTGPPFLRRFESMSPDGQAQYVLQLEAWKREKLSLASSRELPYDKEKDYRLQLEVLELDNKKRLFQSRFSPEAERAYEKAKMADVPLSSSTAVEPELGRILLEEYGSGCMLTLENPTGPSTQYLNKVNRMDPAILGMGPNGKRSHSPDSHYSPPSHPFVSGPSNCLPDYQRQYEKLFEEQQQKQFQAPQHHQMLNQGEQTRADYRVYLEYLEAKKKKEDVEARHKKDVEEVKAVKADHSSQDYQLQLMLLEQQNKKLLMLSHQQQDAMMPPQQHYSMTGQNQMPAMPKAYSLSAIEEHHEMIGKLEAQNRIRREMARQQQELLARDRNTEQSSSPAPSSYGNPTPSSVVYTPRSSVASPPPGNSFDDGRPLPFRTAP